MGRIVLVVTGILVLALVSAGLAELTISLGHKSRITDDRVARPTPSPTPVLTLTATTKAIVRLREQPTTASAVLADVQSGAVVKLGSYSDDLWQEVTYNGVHGYIYRSYLAY